LEKQLWHILWRNYIYKIFAAHQIIHYVQFVPPCVLIHTGTLHYIFAVRQVLPLARRRLVTRGVEESVFIVTALVPFFVCEKRILEHITEI
jgi:hypothetical protein